VIDGLILALDLATECGWAIGHPRDKVPRSGAANLKQRGEKRRDVMGNLGALFDSLIRPEKPKLVVVENHIPIPAYFAMKDGTRRIEFDLYQHGIIEMMTARYGIDFHAVHMAIVRAYFIGHGNMGTRPDTKAAVVQRCHVLGLMPKESHNDNRADAIATWFWAAGVFGSRIGELYLFGEKPSK
jgi:hypothetical protein